MRTMQQLSHHPEIERLARTLRPPDHARRDAAVDQVITRDGKVRADRLAGFVPPQQIPGGLGIELVGRDIVTLDFGAIAGGNCLGIAVPMVGARTYDAVSLGPPPSFPANLTVTGYVSGDDEVTVRVCNPTSGTVDPIAMEWNVMVMR